MGTDRERGQSRATIVRDEQQFDEHVFETQYEYGAETDELTVILIDAIAETEGISPAEVAPRINESVDPDAMERVLRPLPDGSERDGRLTFYLLGYRITVRSDGTVRIFEADG